MVRDDFDKLLKGPKNPVLGVGGEFRTDQTDTRRDVVVTVVWGGTGPVRSRRREESRERSEGEQKR